MQTTVVSRNLKNTDIRRREENLLEPWGTYGEPRRGNALRGNRWPRGTF